MSKRLTDDELADVVMRTARGTCHLCGGRRMLCDPFLRTCPACNGTGAYALATSAMESILLELTERRLQDRARRAADLTAEEREALIDAKWCMRGHCNSVDRNDEHHARALVVLDRLLSHAEGK